MRQFLLKRMPALLPLRTISLTKCFYTSLDKIDVSEYCGKSTNGELTCFYINPAGIEKEIPHEEFVQFYRGADRCVTKKSSTFKNYTIDKYLMFDIIILTLEDDEYDIYSDDMVGKIIFLEVDRANLISDYKLADGYERGS